MSGEGGLLRVTAKARENMPHRTKFHLNSPTLTKFPLTSVTTHRSHSFFIRLASFYTLPPSLPPSNFQFRSLNTFLLGIFSLHLNSSFLLFPFLFFANLTQAKPFLFAFLSPLQLPVHLLLLLRSSFLFHSILLLNLCFSFDMVFSLGVFLYSRVTDLIPCPSVTRSPEKKTKTADLYQLALDMSTSSSQVSQAGCVKGWLSFCVAPDGPASYMLFEPSKSEEAQLMDNAQLSPWGSSFGMLLVWELGDSSDSAMENTLKKDV